MIHAWTPHDRTGSLGQVQVDVNPAWRVYVRRVRVWRAAGVLAASAALVFASGAAAKDLLAGTMPEGDSSVVAFRLDAESREDIVGGRIVLGEVGYEVSKVSRLGLIGARRFVGSDGDALESYAEFLVFSSSFSGQTAVGKPWLAAREAYGCDKPYNSYLAIYRVEGEAAVKSLGPIPYPDLVEGDSRSRHSRVSCFMAHPPE